jgi:hypothetical protein
MHLTIGSEKGGGITHDYCVALQPVRTLSVNPDQLGDVCIRGGHVLEADPFSCTNSAKGKPSVLVDSVEFMDLPQGIRFVVAPSVVRLQRLNDIARRASDTSDLFSFFVALIGRLKKIGNSDELICS